MRSSSISLFCRELFFLIPNADALVNCIGDLVSIFLSLANPLMAGLTGRPACRSSPRRDSESDSEHKDFPQSSGRINGPILCSPLFIGLAEHHAFRERDRRNSRHRDPFPPKTLSADGRRSCRSRKTGEFRLTIFSRSRDVVESLRDFFRLRDAMRATRIAACRR
jgi:hypothetical protein